MARLSSREYQEWIQFYLLDPFGAQRDDMRAAQSAALIARPNYKSDIDPMSLMLFPDDAHALPEDVDDVERQWMALLSRRA